MIWRSTLDAFTLSSSWKSKFLRQTPRKPMVPSIAAFTLVLRIYSIQLPVNENYTRLTFAHCRRVQLRGGMLPRFCPINSVELSCT